MSDDLIVKEEPRCPVFGRCGGCQYQDILYTEELQKKQEHLQAQLAARIDMALCAMHPIVASPKVYHYRNRLDLKLLKTRKDTIHIGYSAAGRGPMLEIESCPIGIEKLSEFIPTLRKEACEALPEKYRMANLTLRCGDGGNVLWGGIGRKSNHLQAADYFYFEWMEKKIYYSLDTFFQSNLSILPLLADALRCMPVWSPEAVVFDLYGGVGLLGLMVHDLVKGVINIEENTHAVAVANHNIKANNISNVAILEGRVENVLPGLLDQIDFEQNILIVDPPRSGLVEKAVQNINDLAKIKYMIYLSCNGETLAANLATLVAGPWKVVSVQPFDFFPRTRHIETLVLLERK